MTAATLGDDILSVLSKILDLLYGAWEILFLWIVGALKAMLPSNLLRQKSLENDVVLITGAGGGLGRQIALRFTRRGARLILWDLNEHMNEETKRLCKREGAEAHTFTVDISNREAIYKNAEKSIQIYGRVDILCANAGIVQSKKFLECPDELMERTMQVNCTSLFYLTKALLPGMIERDHGHVIGICSMAGKVGVKGLVDYCASKFGAVGFMEALRAEFRHRSKNLHVTLVCPYYINTGMFDGVVSSSPYLLPILNVDYVADRTIEAVATNQTVLYLPRFCYWTMIIKELLPTAAAERIGHLVGVDKELNGFYAKKTQPLKA